MYLINSQSATNNCTHTHIHSNKYEWEREREKRVADVHTYNHNYHHQRRWQGWGWKLYDKRRHQLHIHIGSSIITMDFRRFRFSFIHLPHPPICTSVPYPATDRPFQQLKLSMLCPAYSCTASSFLGIRRGTRNGNKSGCIIITTLVVKTKEPRTKQKKA